MNTKENKKLTFARALKTWRREAGFSQAEAAKVLDVSRSYLNQIEAGQRTPGARLVNTFKRTVNSGKMDATISAIRDHDWTQALNFLAAGADPAALLDKLIKLSADESIAPEERLQMTRLILPIVRQRLADPYRPQSL